MNKLPELVSYTDAELGIARASWPAVDRYLSLLERSKNRSLTPFQHLKIQRHNAWVESALALFYSRASDEEICFSWSRAAEFSIRSAYALSGLEKTGVAVFALGKLGAEELNFSSDIDLMFIGPDENSDGRAEAREFIRILNENDEWGFCHRVDLTLRPGGSAAALIPTISQFENHYGYHGEAWERLAFVRFRHIVGGDKSVRGDGASSIPTQAADFSRGFSYRRHLDYSVFEELRILIHRIRSQNPAKPGEYNLKLNPGGIRDIELFVHALQTIHGGRKRELQTHRTGVAIGKLKEAELLSKAEAADLTAIYWYYRNLENRLQAENDEQTYKLTYPLTIGLVTEKAKRVMEISNAGFPVVASAEIPTAENLAKRGFSEELARTALEEIQQTKVHSKKTERDEREKNAFLSGFIDSLEKSGGDLDLGLGLLVDFVKTTRAKATLFSMLNREPALVHQLATLFGVSPWAGSILCSRPELLDSFILRQTVDLNSLDTAQALDALAERRLLGELIAMLHFLQAKDLETCVENLTSLADSIAIDLMQLTSRELGCDPIGIIALGKWGGRELGLRSDLDFVFLTHSKPSNDQQRLARRFLNRMTEAHRGGSIYAIDLRLRPSGHAGPILVEHDQLLEHLKTKAEAWERQSWLRARPLRELDGIDSRGTLNIILDRGISEADEIELARIAKQLFKPIPTLAKSTIDLKLVNGGLAPIEFAAQIGVLRSGPMTSAADRNLLETSTRGMVQFLEGQSAASNQWKTLGPNLREMHLWLRRIEQWIRVTSDVAGSSLNLNSNEFRRFAKTSGENSETFPQLLLSKLEASSENLTKLLGR